MEDKVIPRSDATMPHLRDLYELCREVPDWRKRKGRDYPLPCLLAIMGSPPSVAMCAASAIWPPSPPSSPSPNCGRWAVSANVVENT